MALTPLNFPNAPTIGQTYPSPPVTGQPTYIWDGADWLSYFALGKAYVPLDGSQPMTGLLTLSGDPTSGLNAGTKQYIDAADAANAAAVIAAVKLMRNYIDGLTLSSPGALTTFGVAAGVAMDSTNTVMMTLAAALSKTTGAWAVGSGTGALDTGTIAASTWYHAYLIRRPDTGVVDVLVSLSATAPTLPANYTQFRRIGSMRTNPSSQWSGFQQTGDEFIWNNPVLDLNAQVIAFASRSTPSLTVPPGVSVLVHTRMQINGAGMAAIVTSLYEADNAVSSTAFGISLRTTAASDGAAGEFRTRTDTGRTIGIRAAATGCVTSIVTVGWVDRRGRDG